MLEERDERVDGGDAQEDSHRLPERPHISGPVMLQPAKQLLLRKFVQPDVMISLPYAFEI